MSNIQAEVIKIALKKLFTQNHFSICEIDKCLKLVNVIPHKTEYNTMSALHCVDYSDMSDDVRAWLIEAVKDMFMSETGFDLSFLDTLNSTAESSVKTITVKEVKETKRFLGLL